jgi:DNA-binding CsgD family transcriptional regulator
MLGEKTKSLKPRQTQILKLICAQYTNKEIADALGISSRTVDAHRDVLLKKTNSKNTAGLVIYAIKYKIIELEPNKKIIA